MSGKNHDPISVSPEQEIELIQNSNEQNSDVYSFALMIRNYEILSYTILYKLITYLNNNNHISMNDIFHVIEHPLR